MYWTWGGGCTGLGTNPPGSRILMTIYVLLVLPSLPKDFGVCQYRRMSRSLMVLSPADPAACCPPLSAQPLSRAQAEQVAPLLKALADPVRLRLMSLVASHPGGEACVCDLAGAFDLSQPTISHHLKVLHDSGLMVRGKGGVVV